MNDTLQKFARNYLKEGLSQLTPENHRIFKLMYGRNNNKRSVTDAEIMLIDKVIDEIPPEKLDWAMEQIRRSVEKLEN